MALQLGSRSYTVFYFRMRFCATARVLNFEEAISAKCFLVYLPTMGGQNIEETMFLKVVFRYVYPCTDTENFVLQGFYSCLENHVLS